MLNLCFASGFFWLNRYLHDKMVAVHMPYPQEVEKLIHDRQRARDAKNFVLSDSIRSQLIALGYEVEDTSGGMNVVKPSSQNNFLTIFGSGETSSVGRKIHEYVLTSMELKTVKIAILSTPAGFQPNVVKVHEEIQQFFIEHLANFHPVVTIVYANTREQANQLDIASAIDDADYIFMGPGSPTYAVRHLRDTLLLSKIFQAIKAGKSLCLSSAAAIAFSKYCLPVYEIYKVGEDLRWLEGLNGYKNILDREMTVIPHFNNSEGGIKTDTSRCFMGELRFANLCQMLPEDAMIEGIDEVTAQIWNLSSFDSVTSGKGRVTLL